MSRASRSDPTAQAISAMRAAKEESARLQGLDEPKPAQRPAEAAAAAPVPEDERGLGSRPSACRLCGVTVEPGLGDQFMVARTRKVPGGRETFLVPWWKLCQRCDDIGLSDILWADWLGIDQPFEWGALHELALEFPQVGRETMWNDFTIVKTEGPLPFGPQRYDQEEGARAGDEGYPRPWMHPGAKRGRPAALGRWIELGRLWGEDGRRHDSLACCGVCGRSHARKPIVGPPAGWADGPDVVRWTDLRISGGLLACSFCAKAYRSSSSGGGQNDWTLHDWAAAQAAGAYPVPGLSVSIGQVLARTAPPVPVGEERQPWEHLGRDVLARLRATVARPAKPRNDLSVLDLVRSAR